MRNSKHILIVLPKRLGDAIFYTPALAFLKKHCPHLKIDAIILTNTTNEVFANNPAIEKCFFAQSIVDYAEFAKKYDFLLELHYHHKSIQEIIEKLPIKKFSSGEYAKAIPSADHALQYVSSLLGVPVSADDRTYHLYPTETDAHAVEGLLSQHGLSSSRSLVVLHVGCHGAAKSWWKCWRSQAHEKIWPLTQFIQLMKLMLRHHPELVFVLTGSKAETLLAKKVLRKVPAAIDMTGKTTVMQLAALMARTRLVITGDTGVLHVACAMHTPVVALFGPTEVRSTGPYPEAPYRRVIVKPSLCEITPKEVLQVAEELLLS